MKKTDPLACPVCGMDGDLESPPEIHNGIRYFFCTEQCRERFVEHPSLFVVSRAFGHDKPIMKNRLLRVSSRLDDEQSRLLDRMMDEMMGVKRAVIDGHVLSIEYDLLQATLSQIEGYLQGIGIELSPSITERLKRAWIHEREETELAILAEGKRPCCNEPPHGR